MKQLIAFILTLGFCTCVVAWKSKRPY